MSYSGQHSFFNPGHYPDIESKNLHDPLEQKILAIMPGELSSVNELGSSSSSLSQVVRGVVKAI